MPALYNEIERPDPEINPVDPYDPRVWDTTNYVSLLSRTSSVIAGVSHTLSIYAASATPVTLYLRLGYSRVAIHLTSTLTRFKVTTTPSTTSLTACLEMVEGAYSSLSLTLAWAKLEQGTSATTYCEGAHVVPYTCSATGAVVFASAPTGPLTWSGDCYGDTPYEIATPWDLDELQDVRWVQSADVMIFAHQNHPPQWLGRYGHSDWRLKPMAYVNGPFEELNTDSTATVQVSAVSGTITLTASKSIFTDAMVGRQFAIWETKGATAWETAKAVAQGAVRASNSSNYVADAAGTTGTVRPSHKSDSASDGAVSWTYHNNGMGIVRLVSVSGTTATGFVIKPFPHSLVSAGSAKWAGEPWNDLKEYPGAVTFHQQRLVFAGSPANPDSVWTSKPGSYQDFGTSYPSQDDDGLTLKLVHGRANRIQGLISLGSLLGLTESGTWRIGSDEPMTPSNLSAQMQGFRGAASLDPIGVGNAILYTDRSNNVRDLLFEFASNSYNGNNLNAFAPHLVEGNPIVEWAYQESSSCLWCVRADGVLLGCTYMRDQDVCGWHRHDTDGTFESVCCIPEGAEDALYVTVLRGTKRFLERFANRRVLDVREGWFIDCGLEYDGRNTTPTTITVGSANGVYTATASSAIFGGGGTDPEISFYDKENNVTYRLMPSVDVPGTSTVITVVPNRPLPASYLNVARTDWALGRKTFSGLGHLEGKAVSVLADGAVYAEPVTVSGGAITLNRSAYLLRVGLPYKQDLETLGLNVHGEGTIDKKRIVKAIRCLVDETWSISCGGDESRLRPVKVAVNTYDDPATMQQGLVEKSIESTWDKQGRVLIRNENPLPVSLTAIIPEIVVGGA